MQAQNIIEADAAEVNAPTATSKKPPAEDVGQVAPPAVDSTTEASADQQLSNGISADFLSNLAHQLRSPLSSLRVWVDLLGDPSAQTSPDSMKRLVDGIDRATSRIERQLTDVLEAGYLEAGTLTVETGPVDAVQQLALAVSDTDQQARSRRVGIDLSLGDQRTYVTAAEDRLRQVIGLLLSNSIKFSPVGGKVTVTTGTTAQIASDQAATTVLEQRFEGPAHYFCVSNNGPAIDPELHHEVFRPFYRMARKDAHSGGGSGLGLSIVSGLLRLMHGGIWVRSGAESGVDFEFSLPHLEQAGDAR
jgi:two-component system phosphate regulon sensor histidine kinase PhoR